MQIPLAGGGDRFCKLTFPPSRASAEVVSYDFWDPARNPRSAKMRKSVLHVMWKKSMVGLAGFGRISLRARSARVHPN